MSIKKVYHVAPSQSQWEVEVKVEGKLQAILVRATKEEAVAAGKELAEKQRPCELVVHRLDGSVQRQFTYDKDDASPESEHSDVAYGCMRGRARITGDIVSPRWEEWHTER